MNHALLFNGTLETGVRTLVVLEAAYPRALDLGTLTLLDHLVVHTSDVDGPESLHPTSPQRSGEIFVRRRLIEDSIKLMRKMHLISAISDNTGINYQASDEASSFVELLRTPYAVALKIRAEWLTRTLKELTPDEIRALVKVKLGRWSVEFQNLHESSEI